jgi:hypothetical protein
MGWRNLLDCALDQAHKSPILCNARDCSLRIFKLTNCTGDICEKSCAAGRNCSSPVRMAFFSAVEFLICTPAHNLTQTGRWSYSNANIFRDNKAFKKCIIDFFGFWLSCRILAEDSEHYEPLVHGIILCSITTGFGAMESERSCEVEAHALQFSGQVRISIKQNIKFISQYVQNPLPVMLRKVDPLVARENPINFLSLPLRP